MFSNLPGFQIHYPCIILGMLPSDPWPPPALLGGPMLASKKPTHHLSLCVNSVINLQTAWNRHVILSGKFPKLNHLPRWIYSTKITSRLVFCLHLCDHWYVHLCSLAEQLWDICLGSRSQLPDRKWRPKSQYDAVLQFFISESIASVAHTLNTNAITKHMMFDPPAIHGFTATNLLRHSLQGTKYCKPGKRAWKFDTSQNSILSERVRTCFGNFFFGGGGIFFFFVCGLCACFLSSSRGVVGWCFCGGVVVFLCFCGGVLVVVFLWWCFCGGVFVVVWWCFCGIPCGGVFGVVFLWWCFCGGVCVVWLCFCGGVVVFLSLWWCFFHCGDVFVLVFLWWCGSVFMFLWWCFCVFVVVFWWCFCGVFVVVF